jgi:hypothetical protein
MMWFRTYRMKLFLAFYFNFKGEAFISCVGKLTTCYMCSAIGHVSQLWPRTLPKPMMHRAPTRPIWALVELRDCWTACRTVTPVTANDHSRLQPMTTAGYSQWPQQVADNDHSRLRPMTTADPSPMTNLSQSEQCMSLDDVTHSGPTAYTI